MAPIVADVERSCGTKEDVVHVGVDDDRGEALAATYRAQVTRAGPAGAAGAPPIARCGPPVAEAILAGTLVRLQLRGDRVDVVEAATCALIGSFTP